MDRTAGAGQDPSGKCIFQCLDLINKAIKFAGKALGISHEEVTRDPLSGVTIVENAFGLDAVLVRALALGHENTVTFGGDLIESNNRVYVGSELYRHEQGHVDQARALGWFWLPAYFAEGVREFVLHGTDTYRYNEFERNADLRGGLPLDWHVAH